MFLSQKSPGKSKVTGKNSAKKSAGKPRGWFRPLRWIRFVVVFFLLSTIAAVLLFRFVPPPLTPLMAIRYALAYTGGAQPKLEKTWMPLEKISPRLVEAVIASEDQTFPEHWGFDFEAILSAFSVNGKGKRKLGASTITQQTAKNLFLWPDRSWTRKALEAYFTLLLEVEWNKHRILEVYLNIIEMGNGVYGAEAAANRYFGSTAADLDRNQAALLAAILPNPRAWSPDKPSPYLIRRQTWILRQMDHRGPLPEELSYRGSPKATSHPPGTPRTRESSLARDTVGPWPDNLMPSMPLNPTIPASPTDSLDRLPIGADGENGEKNGLDPDPGLPDPSQLPGSTQLPDSASGLDSKSRDSQSPDSPAPH